MAHRARPWLTLLVMASVLWIQWVPAASAQTAPGRVSFGGGAWYVHGANMPWLNWGNDFGGGLDQAQADSKLAAAQQAGMHVVRWWVFEGGAQHIQHDAAGTPTGIQPQVLADLDAAMSLAAQHDIYYDLVLFASPTDTNVQAWTTDAAKRQALVNVLSPLFKRYASNPHAFTWEPYNEPDWAIRNNQIDQASVLATSDAIANAVHANSTSLVTVGEAQGQDVARWVGHVRDYDSPHWYQPMCPSPLNCLGQDPASAVGSDKPVVVGEMSPNPWQTLYNAGYAGGWCWSLSPEHTNDKLSCDLGGATSFANGKADVGPQRIGGVGGSPTPIATPAQSVPPTAAPLPSPTPTQLPATSSVTTTASQWTITARLSGRRPARGRTITLTLNVLASAAASVIVDEELYGPSPGWPKDNQQYAAGQTFQPNSARTYTFNYTIPSNAPTGTYAFNAGVFQPDWSAALAYVREVATYTLN